MAKLSKDLAAGNLHPRELIFAAGNLAAANAEIVIPADGCNTVTIDLRGTFSLTAEVAGSVDGVNYVPIPVRPVNQALVAYVASVVGAVAGVWTGPATGFKTIRVRATAFTSGSAAATITASTGTLDQTTAGTAVNLIGTATGAAGAAVTLTLAAPAAGLRHYITSLTIGKFASALLTAAATPVVVTTTNLPGALAFSFPADAALAGTFYNLREEYRIPLAASAQGVATTIVCPVTALVIWRVTLTGFVAP